MYSICSKKKWTCERYLKAPNKTSRDKNYNVLDENTLDGINVRLDITGKKK